MENQEFQQDLYAQIGGRTNGEIYLGIVGPVRTGKSTFIKKFMETMVIPRIDNVYKRERAKDELPQSGSGRTIMTAEPKFVPEEAAEINLPDAGTCRVRLIDCVGYMVEGTLGGMEDDMPRMVMTPWREQPIPMWQAAEIGTHKVIEEHSTIGLVITTDGSFSDIPRQNYEQPEGRVIEQLRAIGKPFLVLVNTDDVGSESAIETANQLHQRYGVQPLIVNCAHLDAATMQQILTDVLYEFPVNSIGIALPKFVGALEADHPVQQALYQTILEQGRKITRMRDLAKMADCMRSHALLSEAIVTKMDLGTGDATLTLRMPNEIFYGIVSEKTGVSIKNEADLIPMLTKLTQTAHAYERIAGALEQAQSTGYGVVMPQLEELSLEEPEIIKQGGRYGVKLCASASSIHLIRADIQASVTPIVGTEKQSEDLVHYLLGEFDGAPERIWETNIFGKSLSELVNEELTNKLARMPEDAREKFRETLEKIINQSTGGLICILL